MPADNTRLKIGDNVTWTHIPERLEEEYANMEDHPEFVRLYNVEKYGAGPFTISNIIAHPTHRGKITLVEITDKNGNKTLINCLAFKTTHQ